MEYIYADGGRSQYFKATKVGDCAVRAIANATGKDYLEVYNALKELNGGKSCRNGTPKKVDKKYLAQLGWEWHPTMQIGQGCRVHLWDGELPNGTLVVQIAHHLTCVKDGVIYDTWDCGHPTTCVYGYWTPPTRKTIQEVESLHEEARVLWEEYNDRYNDKLDAARENFLDGNYERAEWFLKQAKEALKKAADARERMDKYKKELIARKAKGGEQ